MSRLLPFLLPEDPATAQYRSRQGVERLAGFSDAVVAIAITLIVLPLVEAATATDASITTLIVEDGHKLGAAALSFAVIGSLWREHHEAFGRAALDSRRLVLVNSIWLASVVFLPVPTALLFSPTATSAEEKLAVALYAATVSIAGFSMRGMELTIRRHGAKNPVAVSSTWRDVLRWAQPVLMAVAATLAPTTLGTRALWVLALILPLQWLSLIPRRHHTDNRRLPARTPADDTTHERTPHALPDEDR